MFENDNKKTIQDYASKIRRELKIKKDNIDRISIETIEPIIIDLINKNPNTHNIKLAMDLIKAKIADRGMQDDIDIDKFVKKALTTIRSQEDDTHNTNIYTTDNTSSDLINFDTLTHSDSDKELEDNMKSSLKSIKSLLNDPEEYE